jgi:hypothetical protein
MDPHVQARHRRVVPPFKISDPFDGEWGIARPVNDTVSQRKRNVDPFLHRVRLLSKSEVDDAALK